ncbi:M48 family metallopeptidase [Chryseolinea soli]|uniref:Peptidase M48 domain-containing protein n=1 Tax=Chryseolinea soli TaxID=2321403 RepID=A0A385SUQ8_9BACT|nr:M48 family metallopeptidase [Chryseolinea soli]AYB33705.1 hypothetical protein D4L85_25375 [Chryseolinea soli]
MRFVFAAVLLAAGCVPVLGQDFDAYKTLMPQGPVPKDFTERTADKVATEVTTVTGKNARQKKIKKKFVLESTFSIDDFLASGSVLFNDEVSLYLDQVLQEILKPYPDLKKKIRVYAVKSTSVNAFTTNNGLIFVNLGLLARLENEAQLAFVLSHEVVHYQKKHVINAYVTKLEIQRGHGDYRKLSVSEKGFAKSTYSKELESEADLDGGSIYLKSNYIKDSIDRVFDVLKLADFPLFWGKFQKERFESGRYVFPDSVTLANVKAIAVDENYDDSESSHPNIKKRREAVRKKFKNSSGGDDYRVSESKFQLARKIARYELCRQFLLEHRYAESLALAMSLQDENARSSYLRETIAKAYYGLALKHLDDKLKLDTTEWVGETSRVATFLKQQSPYELSVLALRQLYLCQEAAPANVEISLMLKDLMRTFGRENDGLAKNFLRTATAASAADLKYPYTQYAFLDFKEPTKFFDLLDKYSVPEKEPVIKKKRRKKSARATPLKVQKIVVVNPIYRKVDTRKRQKVRHVESEEVLVNINEKINAAAGKLDLATDIINPNTMTSGQVAQMQSNTILNDWLDERMRSDGSVSPIYNEMLQLTEKHKTEHFMWMGGLTVQRTHHMKALYVAAGVLVPSFAPFAAIHVFVPKSETLYFALVFNVRTQEMELLDMRPMALRDNKALLQSNIYYTLLKLKKQK